MVTMLALGVCIIVAFVEHSSFNLQLHHGLTLFLASVLAPA